MSEGLPLSNAAHHYARAREGIMQVIDASFLKVSQGEIWAFHKKTLRYNSGF